MIRLSLDIAACYEAMRERAARNGDLMYQNKKNYDNQKIQQGISAW